MRDATDRPLPLSGPDAPRLPREIEADPRHAAVRAALTAAPRLLWSGGVVAAPVVPLSAALRRVLDDPALRPCLVRGLESAAATLAAEARGLAAQPGAAARAPAERVSRLVLVSADGAERFFRQVERLVLGHAPRVLPCVLDCDAATLGAALVGRPALVKLVLAAHKRATAGLLLATAQEGATGTSTRPPGTLPA